MEGLVSSRAAEEKGDRMGIINIIKVVKQVHKEDVVLVKIGKFYQVYGKDAYIISYLFGYKIKKVEDVYMCGFPINSLNRVIAKLEEKKINYIILDRRNNYEVDEIFDNKKLNKYLKYFEKSKKYINNKIRIENINTFLLENIDKENFKNIINQMEEIIDERRKIPSN